MKNDKGLIKLKKSLIDSRILLTSSVVVFEFKVVSNSNGSVLLGIISWAFVGLVGSMTFQAAGSDLDFRFFRVSNTEIRCGGRLAVRPRSLKDALTTTT